MHSLQKNYNWKCFYLARFALSFHVENFIVFITNIMVYKVESMEVLKILMPLLIKYYLEEEVKLFKNNNIVIPKKIL